ncbi:MAG TPA: DUF5694 domain-containing protein [Xanthomonadales bacterium]|nr:DUF5694 domain-containing protein [Xanthomonadales bacterium]
MNRIASFAALLLVSGSLAAAAPAKVLVLGTYHFANPGKDQHNVEAVDVIAPQRQRELEALANALARFRPTVVAVEWPEAVVKERWAAYRDGTLPESRNEVVQIGFRLARAAGLDLVHGIDADGEFPYDAVEAYARAHGQSAILDAAQAEVAAFVARTSALQHERTIGGVLRELNRPGSAQRDHGFYMQMLRIGGGDEQPGVALNVAWYARNMRTCARLVQLLEPGARAVVVFGHGHKYWLERCARDTPGLEFVEAADYLPDE